MTERSALREGLVVSLKKPHPCGTNAWEIMRIGKDVKLHCRGCGQLVRLARTRVERRVRAIIEEEAGGNQQT